MLVNLNHGLRHTTDGAVEITGPKGRYIVAKADTSGYFRVSRDSAEHATLSSHPDKGEALYAACRYAGLDD